MSTDPRIEAAAKAIAEHNGYRHAGLSLADKKFYAESATAALDAADKATTITTVEELDALPEESVIRSSFGTVYERNFILTTGRKFWSGIGHDEETPSTRIGIPARVIHWGTE